MQPVWNSHDVEQRINDKLPKSFSDQTNVTNEDIKKARTDAIILVFIESLQAWALGSNENLLRDEAQIEAFWADYVQNLPDTLRENVQDQAAPKTLSLQSHFANKSLFEIEKEALLLYLSVMQNAKTQGVQLDRFDHELWRFGFDPLSQQVFNTNSNQTAESSQAYNAVTKIIVAELDRHPPAEFEEFVKQYNAIKKNLNKDNIADLFRQFAKGLKENLLLFLNDAEVTSAIDKAKIDLFSTVESLASVYMDFLYSFIEKKYPDLLLIEDDKKTSNQPIKTRTNQPLNIIINFARKLCEDIKPKDQAIDENASEALSLVFDDLVEADISIFEYGAGTSTELEKANKLFHTLTSVRNDKSSHASFILETGLPTETNVKDLIADSVEFNTDVIGFLPNLTAQEILERLLSQNTAYLRNLDQAKRGDSYTKALKRLLNAFMTDCIKKKALATTTEEIFSLENILGHRQEIERLITTNDSSLATFLQTSKIKDSIFSANLQAILISPDLNSVDTQFAETVTAVAILWQHPSVLNKISASPEQIKAFQEISSENKITQLRLAVEWVQANNKTKTINQYYKNNASILDEATTSENRIKNLQILIPAFLAQNVEPSRAFNKGAIHIDEFLVSNSVKKNFADVPNRIANCADLEREIALIIQDTLKAMLEDFQLIFPDLSVLPIIQIDGKKPLSNRQILLKILALQLSYLGKKYQAQANLNGRICGLILGRAEGVVTNTLMDKEQKETSELNTTIKDLEQEVTDILMTDQPIEYENFSVDQGGIFSDFIFPTNDFIVSYVRNKANQALKFTTLEDSENAQKRGIDLKAFQENKVNKAEADAMHQLLLDVLPLYGKIPRESFRSALKGTEQALENFSKNLLLAARDRETETVDQLVKEVTNAAANAKPEKFYQNETSSYEDQLSSALRNNTPLPVYFNAKRIEKYLEKTVAELANAMGSFWADIKGREPIQKLLDSKLPLFIKLKMIGKIAEGKGLDNPIINQWGLKRSYKVQAIYKSLSCFADVTEDTISEKFTEFLRESGEPVAKEVKNIEHKIQGDVLFQLENQDQNKTPIVISPFTDNRTTRICEINSEKFIEAIENRLALSIKSGGPMMTDWLPYLFEKTPQNESDFLALIYNIFTNTRLNVKFAELVTAEKQAEFVTAVAKTLMQYLPADQRKPEDVKRMLAYVQDMFIPINLNQIPEIKTASQATGDDVINPETFEPLQDLLANIKERLADCANIEEELWSITKDILKEELKCFITSFSNSLVSVQQAMRAMVLLLAKLHDDSSTEEPFAAKIFFTMMERAAHFLVTQGNLAVTADGEKRTLYEILDQKIDAAFSPNNLERDDLFGLVSSNGKIWTLSSMALARMSQPDIARQEDTLYGVLNLGRRAEIGKVTKETTGYITNVSGKIDRNLKIDTSVDIWLSLATENSETKLHDFTESAVLDVYILGDLNDVVERTILKVEKSSMYKALTNILPLVIKTIIENPSYPVDDTLETITDLLVTQYHGANTSETVKEILLSVLARVFGKSEAATKLITTQINSLIADRKYDQALKIADLLPKESDTLMRDAASINTDRNAGKPRDVIIAESKSKTNVPVEDHVAEEVRFEGSDESSISHLPKEIPPTSPARKTPIAEDFFFNDSHITHYLINQIEPHVNATWSYERDAIKSMLTILKSELPLESKLNLIGNIAQALTDDATFGSTHGIRRRQADRKLYYDLKIFSAAKNKETSIALFNDYLKENEEASQYVKRIENAVKKYQLILNELKTNVAIHAKSPADQANFKTKIDKYLTTLSSSETTITLLLKTIQNIENDLSSLTQDTLNTIRDNIKDSEKFYKILGERLQHFEKTNDLIDFAWMFALPSEPLPKTEYEVIEYIQKILATVELDKSSLTQEQKKAFTLALGRFLTSHDADGPRKFAFIEKNTVAILKTRQNPLILKDEITNTYNEILSWFGKPVKEDGTFTLISYALPKVYGEPAYERARKTGIKIKNSKTQGDYLQRLCVVLAKPEIDQAMRNISDIAVKIMGESIAPNEEQKQPFGLFLTTAFQGRTPEDIITHCEAGEDDEKKANIASFYATMFPYLVHKCSYLAAHLSKYLSPAGQVRLYEDAQKIGVSWDGTSIPQPTRDVATVDNTTETSHINSSSTSNLSDFFDELDKVKTYTKLGMFRAENHPQGIKQLRAVKNDAQYPSDVAKLAKIKSIVADRNKASGLFRNPVVKGVYDKIEAFFASNETLDTLVNGIKESASPTTNPMAASKSIWL